MTETTKKIEKFRAGNGQKIIIGGESFTSQTAGKSYSLRRVSDKILRFEVRNGDTVFPPDVTNGRDRSEISCNTRAGPNEISIVEYEIFLEPGDLSTKSWCCLGQWHATDRPGEGRSPPLSFQMSYNDQILVALRHGDEQTLLIPWKGGRISRGQWHRIKIRSLFRNNKKGFCNVWFDDLKVVDYSGPLGYDDSNYWKMGIYRPTSDEILAVRYRFFGLDISESRR
jgi:hypothetical protein